MSCWGYCCLTNSLVVVIRSYTLVPTISDKCVMGSR